MGSGPQEAKGFAMKISYHTLGCKVNYCDTQGIMSSMKEYGYETAVSGEAADICIVNTCTVTHESERKARQLIRKLKNENQNALIAVTGCYARANENALRAMPEVSVVAADTNTAQAAAMIHAHVSDTALKKAESKSVFPIAGEFEGRTRAVIKIQDGCDMYCGYCVIPFVRPKPVSADVCGVIENIRAITEKGFLEVVLTGIHLASYRSGGAALIDLIERIGRQTAVKRLRLGSLEPKLLTKDFVSRLKNIECICPHFHISLQSGSNAVLSAMGRRYTLAEYEQVCETVRGVFCDASITTDIIAGYPGETEESFCETAEFIKKMKFAHVHVFPFSAREGTAAYDMPGHLNAAEKQARARRLAHVAGQVQADFYSRQLGKTLSVLAERKNADGFWEGYSSSYLKVRFISENDESNKLNDIIITKSRNNVLFGKKTLI